MKRIVINLMAGLLGVTLLAGCAQKETEFSKDTLKGGVVKAENGEGIGSGNIEDREGEERQAGKKESEKGILDDAEVFSDKEGEETTEKDGSISIVVDGFRFRIPEEYGCFIEEDKGPVIYRDDLFTMLMAIRGDSYEERMEEPKTLMDGAIEAGGEITNEIEETEIDKKAYAWFGFTKDGEDFLVVYTAAADSGKRVGAQLLIEDDEVPYEELLERFAEIAKTAEETDEPDTTQEALLEIINLSDYGEEKEESVLEHGETKLTFRVEPGFYSQFADSDEYWAFELFLEPSMLGSVDCYLEPAEGLDAKIYIDAEQNVEDEDAKIQRDMVEVNGHTFHYYMADYDLNGRRFQKLTAASDAADGYCYVVKIVYIDWEEDMELDDFVQFFYYDVK